MKWGSILKLVGKGALAVGTGGASLAAPGVGAGSMVSDLSDVLGGASKAGAQNNIQQDRNTLDRESIRLGRDRFATAAPEQRMSNSIRAALAKRAAPASVSWGGPGSGLKGELPQFSGGIKSIYSGLQEPDTQGLMDTVLHDQLMAQQQGGISGGGKDTAMPEINKSSTMDKIIGGGSLASSILAAILKNYVGGGDSSGATGGDAGDFA